ncbi:MAG TPA: YdcF family protein [Acetobacteraceae bacterium]|jgi:uncharacterized SAM-binding protein YcdF (DUF218 family)|nr:YdcF family protein [Acetobacteraceae bacterium]
MSLAVLPTALLIPPVNLVPLTVLGLLLRRRHPRIGRLLTVLGLLGLFAFSLPITPALLMRGLEHGLAAPAGAAPPRAVVILSASQSLGLSGSVINGVDADTLTLERLRAGARLARAQALPILVTGGVPSPGRPSLGAVMARVLARDFATPTRWVEARSQNTWQNAEFSAAILREAGISSVYVVSNGWHLRRALIAFRHFGIAATPAPVRLEGWPEPWIDGLIPTAESWHRSYWAMHEWIGCAVYWWRVRV